MEGLSPENMGRQVGQTGEQGPSHVVQGAGASLSNRRVGQGWMGSQSPAQGVVRAQGLHSRREQQTGREWRPSVGPTPRRLRKAGIGRAAGAGNTPQVTAALLKPGCLPWEEQTAVFHCRGRHRLGYISTWHLDVRSRKVLPSGLPIWKRHFRHTLRAG